MPPSKHAVLSASGAHRWLHCNPSARLELEFADRQTEAAAEGTAAHALAEHKLKKALKLRSRKPVSPHDCDEMDAYTDGYVEFVLEQLMDWAEHTLKPKAEMAYQGEGDYVPGPWCTFCKAAVKCRARAEAKLQLAKYEFAMKPCHTLPWWMAAS